MFLILLKKRLLGVRGSNLITALFAQFTGQPTLNRKEEDEEDNEG